MYKSFDVLVRLFCYCNLKNFFLHLLSIKKGMEKSGPTDAGGKISAGSRVAEKSGKK